MIYGSFTVIQDQGQCCKYSCYELAAFLLTQTCLAQINKHTVLTLRVVNVHKHYNNPEHVCGWCIRSMHWQFICIPESLWRLILEKHWWHKVCRTI